MTSGIPVTPDLAATCWRDDLWIATYGLPSPFNALDYFALSPFYDPTANNEAARQRGVAIPKDAPGVDFSIQDSQPPHLYVVRKRFKSVGEEAANLAFYYILDGTIYQAPPLSAAINARIERCRYLVKEVFDEMRGDFEALAEERKRQEVDSATAERRFAFQTTWKREQLVRSERNVLAVLLDHPLPYSSAVIKEEGKGEGTEKGGAMEAGVSGTAPPAASGMI